ncbi:MULTISPECIES: FtsX-like permease family protein [unclassified Flavobacterium]|uniref:ABC transporter permease n=1 Tax=unclassified Flavobacterium TaxID=196869 RepID=UPI0012927F3A|nr:MULTISPECIES: FtsX-like permease family protein [unclassified Flavobacterium]MQP53271.1 FtsX-like permease family protein [Flavobacterium sp. LMO9]MQP63282.1 FtsX-like permease family protein [Flavobacterium sp. LMO6]
MNLSFYIAKRYAVSFSKNKAINIITGIASVGIIASTMALFVFLSVFSGLREFSLNFANASDPDLRIETVTGKTFLVTEKQEELLKKSEYIISFSKIIEERVYFMYDNKETFAFIKGVDDQYIKITDFNKHLYAGEWFEPDSENVVIGADISRKLGLGLFDYNNALEAYVPKPGKADIENPNEAFNKIALLPSGIYSINEELDGKYVFCSMKLAQQFLGLKNNEITNLEIKLKPSADENIVRKELISILGKSIKIKNRAQLNDSLYKMLQSENLFIYLFSTLVVILTLFCLAGAIVMIIIDKRDNLKTLYNIGVTQASIRTIFFTQGIIITLFGLLIGLGIAIGIILLQQHFSFIMITPTMPYPVLFEWKNIGIVVMTIIILGLISSWIASGTVNKKLFS